VAHFSVTGRGRFLGHLDRTEAFRRAVRRAGGRLALSAGMRPKPLLTLALPLGVGVQGLDELCEFELAEEPPEGFAERLGADLPGHMRLLSLGRYEGRRHLAALVKGASFRVSFAVCVDEGDRAHEDATVARALFDGARRFREAAEWMVEEIREDQVRLADVRRYVNYVDVQRDSAGRWCVEFAAAVTPTGTARPENVLKALEQASGLRFSVRETIRTGIMLERE
jgi:radical SAM-linked protein